MKGNKSGNIEIKGRIMSKFENKGNKRKNMEIKRKQSRNVARKVNNVETKE